MVFQFSSSGGTFPISTTSPFFQALNPFMPFTYAISLLREAVGGILWTTALRDIAMLAAFIALSLIVALALKRPLSGIIRRSTENAKKRNYRLTNFFGWRLGREGCYNWNNITDEVGLG